MYQLKCIAGKSHVARLFLVSASVFLMILISTPSSTSSDKGEGKSLISGINRQLIERLDESDTVLSWPQEQQLSLGNISKAQQTTDKLTNSHYIKPSNYATIYEAKIDTLRSSGVIGRAKIKRSRQQDYLSFGRANKSSDTFIWAQNETSERWRLVGANKDHLIHDSTQSVVGDLLRYVYNVAQERQKGNIMEEIFFNPYLLSDVDENKQHNKDNAKQGMNNASTRLSGWIVSRCSTKDTDNGNEELKSIINLSVEERKRRKKRSLRSRPKFTFRKILKKVTPTKVIVGAHAGTFAYKEYKRYMNSTDQQVALNNSSLSDGKNVTQTIVQLLNNSTTVTGPNTTTNNITSSSANNATQKEPLQVLSLSTQVSVSEKSNKNVEFERRKLDVNLGLNKTQQ